MVFLFWGVNQTSPPQPSLSSKCTIPGAFQGVHDGLPHFSRCCLSEISKGWWNQGDLGLCGGLYWWTTEMPYHDCFGLICPWIRYMVSNSSKLVFNFSMRFFSQLVMIYKLGHVRSIPVMCAKDFQEEDLQDPMVDHMLQSFRYVRCAYKHFDVPSHHYLHALRLLVDLPVSFIINIIYLKGCQRSSSKKDFPHPSGQINQPNPRNWPRHRRQTNTVSNWLFGSHEASDWDWEAHAETRAIQSFARPLG